MKKVLALAFAGLSLAACNDNRTDNSTVDSATRMDTSSANMDTGMSVDTSHNTAVTSSAYSPSEGDVTYRERKVRVYRSGAWVDADKDVTLDDGTVVYRD